MKLKIFVQPHPTTFDVCILGFREREDTGQTRCISEIQSEFKRIATAGIDCSGKILDSKLSESAMSSS